VAADIEGMDLVGCLVILREVEAGRLATRWIWEDPEVEEEWVVGWRRQREGMRQLSSNLGLGHYL